MQEYDYTLGEPLTEAQSKIINKTNCVVYRRFKGLGNNEFTEVWLLGDVDGMLGSAKAKQSSGKMNWPGEDCDLNFNLNMKSFYISWEGRQNNKWTPVKPPEYILTSFD